MSLTVFLPPVTSFVQFNINFLSVAYVILLNWGGTVYEGKFWVLKPPDQLGVLKSIVSFSSDTWLRASEVKTNFQAFYRNCWVYL